MPPRGRALNNSILSIVDGFSEDEFNDAGDNSHMITAASSATRNPRRQGTRTKTVATNKGAAAAPTIGETAAKPAARGRGRPSGSKNAASSSTRAAGGAQPAPARPGRRAAATRAAAATKDQSFEEDFSLEQASEIEKSPPRVTGASSSRKRPAVAAATEAHPAGRASKIPRKAAQSAALSEKTDETELGDATEADERDEDQTEEVVRKGELSRSMLSVVGRSKGSTLATPLAKVSSTRKNAAKPLPSKTFSSRNAASSDREGWDRAATSLETALQELDEIKEKYQHLIEITEVEARRNFDSFREAAERRSDAQHELIESLRAELDIFRAQSTESAGIETRIAELETKNSQLLKERDTLLAEASELQVDSKRMTVELKESKSDCERMSTEINSLSTSLKMLEKDNKSISAKLASMKTKGGLETGSANGRTQSSTGPKAVMGSRNAAAMAEELAQTQKLARLREELYCDLSGLMIHCIKKEVNEESEEMFVFDCSQTGKNGTLRFHLQCPTNEKIADPELVYVPMIDPMNDRALVEILPDYLQEDIQFPREFAAKFYQRIIGLLEASRADEEEDEE